MAQESSTLTEKAVSGSPYQLDQAQTLKAARALLKHIQLEIQRKEASSTTRNLLADSSDNSSEILSVEPIWLVLTTKKHIVDQKRLKPGKIPLPHPINTSSTTTVCLITADPQRTLKDVVAHPSFPSDLATRITKVIGLTKLKARYKSFESRRQLLAEHDVFLADSRIVTYLPNVLGKTFYKGTKRPVPVIFPVSKDSKTKKSDPVSKQTEGFKALGSPKVIGREIERALSSALVHLSPAATTSVRIGLASFSPDNLAENVTAVVNGMVEKFVTKGWRNIRAIHIKGPNTIALPIWLASELWVEEEDVLGDAEFKERIEKEKHRVVKVKKKAPKSKEGSAKLQRIEGSKQLLAKTSTSEMEMSPEMQERRAKLRAQMREATTSSKSKGDEQRKRKASSNAAADSNTNSKPTIKKARKSKEPVNSAVGVVGGPGAAE